MIMLGPENVASPSSAGFSPPDRLFHQRVAGLPEKPIDRPGRAPCSRVRRHQLADMVIGRAVKVEFVMMLREIADATTLPRA